MKLFSKSIFIASFAFTMFQVPIMADNDKPIEIHELPQAAQQMLKSHFSNLKIKSAEVEVDGVKKTYEVEFHNGTKIEFNKNGKWKEIDCEQSAVPAHFIPAPIQKHVHKNWPKAKIVKIEKSQKQFEVELSNDKEITYNKNFKVLKVEN